MKQSSFQMSEHSGEVDSGELIDVPFDFKDITWNIPNVLSLPELPNYKVQSPSFSFAGATWKLCMYPYGSIMDYSIGHIDLMIERLEFQDPDQHIFYRFFFITRNGKEFDSYSGRVDFDLEHEEGGIRGYMKKDIFMKKKHIIAPKGVLTVVCQMRAEKDRYSQIAPTTFLPDYNCTPQPHVTPSVDNVLRDFKKLFLIQEECDVVIKVKGQDFQAHKAILIARSSVLASTFRCDMKEKSTGIIDIKDCDPSSFSDFLCFLYCGNVDNLSVENVSSLFTTADKYDVQDLRSLCLEFMKKNLSVDTFCDTVTLALKYFEKELIELCSEFFAKNLQEIIVTVKWQSFLVENPIQSNEIMIKSLVKNKKK